VPRRVRDEKSLILVKPELVLEWDDTRNPNEFEIGSHYKARWKCKICAHSWATEIRQRALKNRGCTSCSRSVVHSSGNNSMSVTNPLMAKELHPTKNGNLNPQKLLAGTNKNLWWKCSVCDNEWQTRGQHRANGSGCPYCNRSRLHSDGRNSVASDSRLAFEYNIKRNKNVSIKSITTGSQRRVWWKCKDCGNEWRNSPSNRYRFNQDCGFCAKNSAHSDGVGSMLETHPQMAMEIHPTKNGDLDPKNVLAGTNKKINWLCSKCDHEWEASGSTRVTCWNTASRGCGYCSGNFLHSSKINSMKHTHPHLCEEWHPTKNGNLSTDNIIAGTNRMLHWICSLCKHEWQGSGASRTSRIGMGCPKCSPGGFRKDLPAVYYVMKISMNDVILSYKGGITGNLNKRIRSHKRNFAGHYRSRNWKIELVDTVDFPVGEDALKLENKLLVSDIRAPNIAGLSSELFLHNPITYAREKGFF